LSTSYHDFGTMKLLLAKIYISNAEAEKSDRASANFGQQSRAALPCLVLCVTPPVENGLSHSLASAQNSKWPIDNSFTDHVVT
jgi:hypothetical protein